MKKCFQGRAHNVPINTGLPGLQAIQAQHESENHAECTVVVFSDFGVKPEFKPTS